VCPLTGMRAPTVSAAAARGNASGRRPNVAVASTGRRRRVVQTSARRDRLLGYSAVGMHALSQRARSCDDGGRAAPLESVTPSDWASRGGLRRRGPATCCAAAAVADGRRRPPPGSWTAGRGGWAEVSGRRPAPARCPDNSPGVPRARSLGRACRAPGADGGRARAGNETLLPPAARQWMTAAGLSDMMRSCPVRSVPLGEAATWNGRANRCAVASAARTGPG